ncbi:MAG: cytochrome P450 [Ilumatobacteraceae bacterium]
MGTPTLASELDLPVLEEEGASARSATREQRRAAAQESWIARNAFGYSILHYDDVVAMLRDRRWHSATSRLFELSGVEVPEAIARRPQGILSAEGEEHTRLRRLVGRAFSPRAADRLRPFMREVVDGLVDAVAPAGRADIAIDICEPYPIPIICELLGAPKEDWKLFSHWATDVLRIFNGTLQQDLPAILAAQEELDEYTRGLIAERRDKPAEDLLTDLIAAEEAGDRLSEEELVMMVEAVIIAGTDTTRNQLGCSVALLADHPKQWELLAERPELAAPAVEETMRYFGAVRGTGRFASEDIEYRDVLFPQGTFIAPSVATANFDPTVFVDPERFDITRDPPAKPQLTFGSGIHYCLGAALARAELQEALPLLARRMPELALDGPPTWKPNAVGIFGPDHLPVTFAPGH